MTIVEKAIQVAKKAHYGQKRKGTDRDFFLHPLEVMSIVGGLTEDEEVLAAAVLHDTIEDTKLTKTDIEEQFGKRVADLVAAESEDKREDQPAESTWKTRKEETIEHLKRAGRDIKLICLGDKLANIREMYRDHELIHDALWERFNQKDKSLHKWYYSSIYEILSDEFGDVPPIREYRELLGKVFDDTR